MTSFITYLKERFNIAVFAALTLFLLFFSKSEFRFDGSDLLHYFFLLFFLLITRLYDDLLNAAADKDKPNRSYTEEKNTNTLTYFLLGLSAIFLLLLFFYDPHLANFALIFLVGNHLLYLLLYKTWNFKQFLPLLKYPMIFLALQGHFSGAAISLFLAFIVYEIMDDPEFPLSKTIAYLFTLAAFFLLLTKINFNNDALFILLFLAAIASVRLNKKHFAYLFLLLFLFARLITLIHEV